MEGRFAIIISNGGTAYFLFDDDEDTTIFDNPDDAQNWIDENERSGHEYTIWDCMNACVY